MVMFTAPWCVHCTELSATYNALAGAFLDEGERVTVATVNADENRGLSERFDVGAQLKPHPFIPHIHIPLVRIFDTNFIGSAVTNAVTRATQ
jgi:thiol-disulfide isomerase/thioredoxin